MNNGAFGENFPYSNFHDLNMDWIIKTAKDFLDQYSHIQEVIAEGEESLENLTTSGLAQLQEKADTLEALLQAWYDEHSEDIADQLADALADLNAWYNEHSEDISDQLASALSDLNAWYTEHQGYLDSYVQNSITEFETTADAYVASVIQSIPPDYSTLASDVSAIEKYQATGKYSATLTPASYPTTILTRGVTFAKNHVYHMEFESTIFTGSACQIVINGTPKNNINPINGTYIVADEDITSMGIYIPQNAVSGTGDIVLKVTDDYFIPDSQAFQVLGNLGNKYKVDVVQGYSNSLNNSYTDTEVNKTHNLNVSIESGYIDCVCVPTAYLPANTTFRLAIEIDKDNNAFMYAILTPQTSSWQGGLYILGESKPGNYFLEITPEMLENKSYIMFRFQSGTVGKIRFYIANKDLHIIENNMSEMAVYEAYKATEADHAMYAGKKYDTDIIGWGDSIMQGTGATDSDHGFFKLFTTLMNTNKFINAACGGETIWTIAARQGATTVKAPAGNPSIGTFALVDELGRPVRPLIGGYLVGNGDPYTRAVKLNTYTGNLGRSGDDQYNIDINQSFSAATPIHFPGADYIGQITIIFAGTNNWNSANPTEDIPYINAMIERAGTKKYVIMGIYKENNEEYDSAMIKEFGAKFFNTRSMVSKYGMTIAGLTPTAEDLQAMEQGLVPPSLLSDNIHPNNYGHYAIATLLYQHVLYLGYTIE